MSTSIQPYLIGVKEAARLLSADPWPVMQLCMSGELPFTHIGERLLIPTRSVREYAERVRAGELVTTPEQYAEREAERLADEEYEAAVPIG